MNENIEVTVRCDYRPESSDPASSRYAFAYHITISNRGTEHAQRRHLRRRSRAFGVSGHVS